MTVLSTKGSFSAPVRARSVTRRSGSAWALVLATLVVSTGCAGPASEAGQESFSTEEKSIDETTGASSSSGDEAVVDWSEGLTQEEQLAEIEFVVSVMQSHFGEEVARLQGGEWDLEGFANLKGNPIPSHRADDHYFYEVEFDFSEIEANQETQGKALAVLEEIGLSPNGEQPTNYGPGRRNPLYVAGGEDDYGRLFLVQQPGQEAGITAAFTTRHSDHQSMYEAHEASWE